MLKATAVAIVLLTCAAACEPRALASESLKFSSSPSLGLRDAIHIAASTKPAKPAGEEPETSRRGELPPVKSSGTAQKFAGALEVVVSLGAISGIVLAAIASAAALFYGRRIRGRQDEPSPVSSLPGNASKSESSESDTVEVSAFAPAVGKAEEEVLVQLFFHKLDQTAVVESQAEVIDGSASIRGKSTLSAEIPRGERIDLVLEGASDLRIDEPSQYLIWRGEPRSCQFIVTLPALQDGRRTFHLRARFFLAGVPVGSIRFPLIVSSFEESTPLELAGISSQRNRRAFLSYASADRAEVLKRMQALKVANIECFQDFVSLDPGERWERRLYEEIDHCDLFVLFWSSAASKSQWVAQEAQYALQRRRAEGDGSIEIAPIILEGPPIPAAPEALKEIHFNDAIRYLISAVEAEKHASRVNQQARFRKIAKVPASDRRKKRPSKIAAQAPKWVSSARRIARTMIEG